MSRPRRAILEYRNYELPADFPLIVLTGDEWRISATPSNRLHFHNCLEIGYCHSGSGSMLINRQRVDFGPGTLTCIARNVPHTTWSAAGDTSLWSYIFMDPELLLGQELLRLLESPAPGGPVPGGDFASDCQVLLPAGRAPWAAPLMQAILSETAERGPGYRLCVRGYCLALLVHLTRSYNESLEGEPTNRQLHALSPALDYIRRNYMRPFAQDRLAVECHLSQSHFRRLFREQMGVTPLAFFHQTRIRESCALLRSSERLISEVAAMVGYESLSCFNRHFIEIMGCTPSEWRRAADSRGRPSLLAYSGWLRAETFEEMGGGEEGIRH